MCWIFFSDVTKWMTTAQPKTLWPCASHIITSVRPLLNPLHAFRLYILYVQHERVTSFFRVSELLLSRSKHLLSVQQKNIKSLNWNPIIHYIIFWVIRIRIITNKTCETACGQKIIQAKNKNSCKWEHFSVLIQSVNTLGCPCGFSCSNTTQTCLCGVAWW